MPNEIAPEYVQALRSALDKLTAAQAFVASREILSAAQQCANAGNVLQAQALCERVIELNDPLFVSEALFTIAINWHRAGRSELEQKSYQRLLDLPPGSRDLVDPLKWGVSLSRSGHTQEAEEHYLKHLSLAPSNANLQGNLAELLLTMTHYSDCINCSNQLIKAPQVEHQIIGRFFKACALFLQGSRAEAATEFQSIGNILISTGQVPPTFAWDFDDSRQTLNRVELAVGALIIGVLDKTLPFPEFTRRWSAMFPPQNALPSST
jgi:tetratricopeptide (TPR) repeat protein